MYWPLGEICAAGDLGVAEDQFAVDQRRQARRGRALLLRSSLRTQQAQA